jgi:hypothetical protein
MSQMHCHHCDMLRMNENTLPLLGQRPGRSVNCAAPEKARVRTSNVAINPVMPDAARIIATIMNPLAIATEAIPPRHDAELLLGGLEGLRVGDALPLAEQPRRTGTYKRQDLVNLIGGFYPEWKDQGV